MDTVYIVFVILTLYGELNLTYYKCFKHSVRTVSMSFSCNIGNKPTLLHLDPSGDL